jgi:hypothetical protein
MISVPNILRNAAAQSGGLTKPYAAHRCALEWTAEVVRYAVSGPAMLASHS